MSKIIKTLKARDWLLVLLSVVFIVFQVQLDLKLPDYMSEVTKLVQTPGSEMSDILLNGGKMLLCALGSLALAICTGFFAAKLAARFSFGLRESVYKKVMSFSSEEINNFSTASLITRSTNDITQVQMFMAMGLQVIIKAPIMAVVAIGKISTKSSEWSVLTICVVGFICLILAFIMIYAVPRFKKIQWQTDTLNRVTSENLSGLLVVRAYNAEKFQEGKFSNANNDLTKTNLQAHIAIVAFMVYVRLFTNPLSQLAQAVTSLQSTAAASERVFEFLEAEEMQNESKKALVITDVKGDVEFKNVKFGYTPDKTIIKNFSEHILPGQKVAIVGPTGAGKTTLVNLLMKFYETDGGEILIDGTPISELKRENIHDLFGMVLQDTWLFEGTVRENICYGKENIPDERLDEVCKAVGLYHFIQTLPHGYDTVIDDKLNLSAGQKQLLTIARAMIENAPMLILDEATSSVDTRTELMIQEAMDKLTKNRTSFVIAHRLSTIKNADKILVLRDGDVVESGSHDELIVANGFYAQLYNSQFEAA